MIKRNVWTNKSTPISVAAEEGCLWIREGKYSIRIPLKYLGDVLDRIHTVEGIYRDLNAEVGSIPLPPCEVG